MKIKIFTAPHSGSRLGQYKSPDIRISINVNLIEARISPLLVNSPPEYSELLEKTLKRFHSVFAWKSEKH